MAQTYDINKRVITLSIILTLCASFVLTSAQVSKTSYYIEIEDFDYFIERFYADTSFQKSRIVIPLQGKIVSMHETENSIVETTWEGRKIIVTRFEEIKSSMKNVKQTYIILQESTIEKIYIENSGFLIERTFQLQKERWYLTKYDIVNI
ncbi:MAG: hypothetical protein DRI70_09765 [Bacteroidetes bacterium]|nr:MAG: hypothetical protein DRI70_09765 [Bacteroidota bacterium]